MNHEQPERQGVSAAVRAVLTGAGLGMIVSVLGTVWSAYGEGVRVARYELQSLGLAGTIGGAAIALVLHLTRDYRARGKIQHYCSWILASVFGVLVLQFPELPRDWSRAILFALWLGASIGLGLGIIARQLSGHRW
jgi:hypothetical protein